MSKVYIVVQEEYGEVYTAVFDTYEGAKTFVDELPGLVEIRECAINSDSSYVVYSQYL